MQDAKARPQLLPLLRSPFQGELLAWLYLHPDKEYSATEMATRFGVSQSTASREADRLAGVGLIRERRVGNVRLLRANPDTPLARPLTDLLAATFGPVAILGELLAEVSGIGEAFVHGSWAARYQGEPGDVPHDVDVLVIGAADEDDLTTSPGSPRGSSATWSTSDRYQRTPGGRVRTTRFSSRYAPARSYLSTSRSSPHEARGGTEGYADHRRRHVAYGPDGYVLS
jgi:DNA-binding transcriptional ArsR family regulator